MADTCLVSSTGERAARSAIRLRRNETPSCGPHIENVSSGLR
jgi:hypothetical protein